MCLPGESQEKAREFQKNIYFCFIDYAKAFDCVDDNKLWKILKDPVAIRRGEGALASQRHRIFHSLL